LKTDAWLGRYERLERHHQGHDDDLAYFKRIFDDAPAAYVVTGAAHLIVDANGAAQRMFNRPLDQLRGKPLNLFVSTSDRHIFRTLITDIEAADDTVVRPLSIGPDREMGKDVIFCARAMRGPDGNVEGIYWLFVASLFAGETDLL